MPAVDDGLCVRPSHEGDNITRRGYGAEGQMSRFLLGVTQKMSPFAAFAPFGHRTPTTWTGQRVISLREHGQLL